MVLAWYMDDSLDEQSVEHKTNPPNYVSLEKLMSFGVDYWEIDLEHNSEILKKIIIERSLNYQDEVICSREGLPDYDIMVKKFYEEHLHQDDETRLVLEGSGYFDIRDPIIDKWIRISVVKNDMISIPAGLYHRFTTDEKNFIKAKRFFAGAPNWKPLNRGSGDFPVQVEYMKKYANFYN